MEERGLDTLRPKGVWNRRSLSTVTPMNWSTSPPRSGSARVTSWRAGELRIASRLDTVVSFRGLTRTWIHPQIVFPLTTPA